MTRTTVALIDSTVGGRKCEAGARRVVLLADHDDDWPPDLETWIVREGYVVVTADVDSAPLFVVEDDVVAVLVSQRSFGFRDRLTVERCRELAPRVPVVVITTQPGEPALKLALESGATAFLSWPAPPDVVRQALGLASVRAKRS